MKIGLEHGPSTAGFLAWPHTLNRTKPIHFESLKPCTTLRKRSAQVPKNHFLPQCLSLIDPEPMNQSAGHLSPSPKPSTTPPQANRYFETRLYKVLGTPHKLLGPGLPNSTQESPKTKLNFNNNPRGFKYTNSSYFGNTLSYLEPPGKMKFPGPPKPKIPSRRAMTCT